MNRTAQLFFVVIALMVSGCSKQSQVQSATTSKPSVVQAAAPATPEPPATPPRDESVDRVNNLLLQRMPLQDGSLYGQKISVKGDHIVFVSVVTNYGTLITIRNDVDMKNLESYVKGAFHVGIHCKTATDEAYHETGDNYGKCAVMTVHAVDSGRLVSKINVSQLDFFVPESREQQFANAFSVLLSVHGHRHLKDFDE
jgi:hypothetical protein